MEDIVLSPVQEQRILDLWNEDLLAPPSLKEIVVALFGEGHDGRSLEARAIKKFLASRNIQAQTTKLPPTEKIELSEAHKEYIKNNVSTMTSIEMARILFANNSLNNFNGETRVVNEFIKSFNPIVVFNQQEEDDVPSGKYQAPETLDEVIKRVSIFLNFLPDRSKITASQRKNLDMLIGYLHTYRFIAQMNCFDKQSDRKLCEDAFIRATYDKPDLLQEEIDQYIEYANQVVNGSKVQRRKEKLESVLEEITGNDPDTIKISMSLVEAIGKASTEFHQCKQREQKLLDDLKQKRSVRLSKQLQDNASILNLVQLWKEEEGRTALLKHAEKEQKAIAEEVENLSTMAEVKARIFGLVKNEIKYE